MLWGLKPKFCRVYVCLINRANFRSSFLINQAGHHRKRTPHKDRKRKGQKKGQKKKDRKGQKKEDRKRTPRRTEKGHPLFAAAKGTEKGHPLFAAAKENQAKWAGQIGQAALFITPTN
ncbi:MAG TPA: hypothetical protein DIW77_08280 [Chromatiaceae bacterium]|jgi:hypothetical protein|nr:MAG: hypothetical protein N838_24820 [Thiohalocapsa sp. PB-PSB1]HCS90042.1 hypothetical protein [Chromatiaceae bacterium]